ncbi:DEAD/DEAH box helicase [Bacillus solimangrovi]|uniref:DEAD-box ATP-dependent RNA helicase CshA n=1 Tax=Bacillus solimangrovi TaxID=1305675 RepID=A0A1E5LG57_9BACI|nr:DEAD/DEAH box helicase [Bacillus solimangrovi]OEH93061.1 DEAD/DEAH box helicase [Bacillus solimangrovi]
MGKFSDLAISQTTLKSIQNMGFEETTAIQEQAIPLALEGTDVIGQAQTGTGKTAAFGIPLVEKIEKNNGLQGIIIAPTRELAIQVAEELNKIGRSNGLQTVPVYGGQDIRQQIRSLKKRPHIVAGTPGRLLDHIRRKTIRLDQIQTAVLDEADEMLNMGFIEDIEAILKEMPEQRQTLLFSATMPAPIQRIAETFMKEPKVVKVKSKEMTVPSIEQFYMKVKEKDKFDALTRMLDIHAPELAIVFGRTKRRVDELSEGLKLRGYSAEGIHGDLTQSKRMAVLRRFKNGQIDVLVATDVAARGLDISGVTHVYNFDLPQDPESYVHRIGRTGRAGKTGIAISFVEPREMEYLGMIEQKTKRKMERQHMPTFTDALKGQQSVITEQLIDSIESGDLSIYEPIVEELLETYDANEIIAAALKSLTKEPDQTPVKLTFEGPLPSRKRGGNRSRGRGRGRDGNKRSGNNNRGNQNRNNERSQQKRSGGGNRKRRYSNN